MKGITIKMKNKLKRAAHNIVGHPLMEICFLFGAIDLGNWIHNKLFKYED